MATKAKSEKKQHIQVFTRVRPLNTQELRSQVVVQCKSAKEVSVKEKNQTKTFSFDRVFGPDSKQVDVYIAVVSPLIEEVLQGYSCTVFAYGQTGTGKTYTMIGEQTHGVTSWEQDQTCGIIPRTLNHLFDELKVRADEFTVRVSFLELYNEELFDLLAASDSEDGKSLKIFEDSTKKGSVIVSGLEERTVHAKNDVYAILEAGNIRRQTAPTLMNAQSSRSHTIFTITVHIKVTTPEGEDLIKTGKLNLVDLAGSENIGRSGAVEMRAREAGNINQSLLTLGRVITSLVERTPHVPYRESKLTRLLQDSLGGRTKTSIIATVSPALCNIEETLSTFEYAHRARNITNKPEINQKTSKSALIKDYTEEIERLRRDLNATRDEHGVYMASENYKAIMAEKENLNKEIVTKLQLLKVREEELIKIEEIMNSLNMSLFEKQNELSSTCQKLQDVEKLCSKREDMFNKLSEQTNVLLKTADEAVNDIKSLHDRLERSRKIQEHNLNQTEIFKNKFCCHLSNMKNRTQQFSQNASDEVERLQEFEKKLFHNNINHQNSLIEVTNRMISQATSQLQEGMELISNRSSSHQNFLTKKLTELKSMVDKEDSVAHSIITNLIAHSKGMKSSWEKAKKNEEESQKAMESQKMKIKEFVSNISRLSKEISTIPELFESKLNENEESLKYYKNKYESFMATQADLKKEKQELLESFYQELKNKMEKEKEIGDRLESTIKEEKEVGERLCKEISQSVNNGIQDVVNYANNSKTLKKQIEEDGSEAIKKTQESIHLINDIVSSHQEWSTQTEKHINNNIQNFLRDLSNVVQSFENELKKVSEASQDTNSKFSEMISTMDQYEKQSIEIIENGVENLQNGLQDCTTQNQNLTRNLENYLEELFSNIHDRIKEIDNLLSKEMKADEKTGTTPQRKNFNYPKRLIRFSSGMNGDDPSNEQF